ncbi:GNAT family N-acetyltransferase [Paenibacillus spongiae]|uniref:GNAT family N-acetyltransferase n=1 Tax=Paenibacillus spongiae TaxID=2909671 RepID=A0ABY5S6I5_9BACL|nr:GNAT family N-acetyltransferase [Paenibacillus spongiae]UVI29195.1 GNAT family N-acetyltransferase [Paenibacillus spongiae]
MEFRSIRSGELQMWSELCREVFDKETGREHGDSFLRMAQNDPWKEQNSILVAVDESRIVSTVQIYCRTTMVGAQAIKTGCIGGVCTNPAYRGQGLTTRLLHNAIDIMREQDIPLSMLTSGIWSFYERSGWENVDWHWKIANFEVDDRVLEAFTVRPVRMEDMDAIKILYAKHSRRFNGPIVRDRDDYWSRNIQMENKPCWVAVDHNGDLIAYVWLYIRDEDQYSCVIEYGEAAPGGRILERMLNRICLAYGWKTCRLRAQSGVHFDFGAAETTTYPGIMYRLIDPIQLQDERIATTGQLIRYLNRHNKPDRSDFINWDHDNV